MTYRPDPIRRELLRAAHQLESHQLLAALGPRFGITVAPAVPRGLRVDRLQPPDEAAHQLIDRLLLELDAGLPLSELLAQRPQAGVWTPGMPNIGTKLDLVTHAAADPRPPCGLCGAGEGSLRAPASVTAGPVVILSPLCTRCRAAEAPTPYDQRLVRARVVELVALRYHQETR